MVYTLSLHHPLRVMEEICMLDQMSGGRIELGVGRGISPLEATYYGADPKQSRDVYVEVLDILLKAFQTQTLDYEGKFYRFKATPIVIAPLQRPHPPLWYGVVGPEGVDWPAKNGMNIGTNALSAQVREVTDRYREQWRQAGRDAASLPLLGMSRHVVIAETDAEALAVARRSYRRWYDSFTYLWHRHGMAPISAAYPDSVDQSIAIGMSFVGSPATVRTALAREIAATGVNYLMLRLAFGDLTLAESLRSLDLFTREVAPSLEAPSLGIMGMSGVAPR
jgi:alkanesulfonate monooxygenase SsuD/methylene tetrahydromethanopterin reductase-like flavin-dependent oxidoreductase (luciferase family)